MHPWHRSPDVLPMEDRFQSTALCHTNMTVHATTAVAAPIAPPGFCNRGEVRYGSIWGLEYEVPPSQLYCLCINLALCSTAVQCICRVIRRSSMTFYTYCIIFGRQPIGGKLPPFPLAAPLGGAKQSKQADHCRCKAGQPGRWETGNRNAAFRYNFIHACQRQRSEKTFYSFTVNLLLL